MKKSHTNMSRCILMSLFARHSELQELPHYEDIFHLGGVFSKHCIFEIVETVDYAYTQKLSGHKPRETVEQRAAYIEEKLLRTNSMLEELQNEFEIKINESKAQEITSFFSALNSEKYGFILDGLFSAKAGLDTLKKGNYELPVEINGLTILIRKLIQFVKDSGIDPILRIGSVMTVKSGDIENYNYTGTPFTNDVEEKQVEVISPGWKIKNKEIQLSRPQIKELSVESEE